MKRVPNHILMRQWKDDLFDQPSLIPDQLSEVILEDILRREAGNLVPDTSGADQYFIDGFFTDYFQYDFWTIAKDFLNHHYLQISEFNNIEAYMNGCQYLSDPSLVFKKKIFGIMYNVAKSGDEYSVNLLQNLYKTYHKYEYKQLKRFKEITVSEIFSLSKDNHDLIDYETMGRILGMCSIYGIKLEDKCSVLYIYLNKKREELLADFETDFYHFPEGLYQSCLEQIDIWRNEESAGKADYYNSSTHFWKIQKFVGRCLERYAYPEDYVFICDYETGKNRDLMAQTLALLKSIFPTEDFTYEDVQTYAHLYKTISALVCVCDTFEESTNELFGIGPELNGFGCLYKPETVPVVKKKVQSAVPKTFIHFSPKNGADEKEEYLKEIADLRSRLHRSEEEKKHWKSELEVAKRELKERQEELQYHQNERAELIALRNHLYQMAETDLAESDESIEEMKQYISARKIAIVGGHTNWTNKLKKEFPEWKFLDANISRINESILLDGTEKLYFFTNHLSHGTYGIYINMVREKRIPFGYIHSVNIETMIKQIYNDLK